MSQMKRYTPREIAGLIMADEAWGDTGWYSAAEADALFDAYEQVSRDRQRLVRELDVALSGEAGAAPQAALCDLVAVARKLRADHQAALEQLKKPALNLTGMQVNLLRDFMDGNEDEEVHICWLDAGKVLDDDGSPYPAGFFACSADYPEEGYLHLPATPKDVKP